MPGPRFPRGLLAAVFFCLAAGLAPSGHAEPAALHRIALLDQRGQAVTPASLDGRVLVLHFVFTGCSAVCPTQVRELALAHDALAPTVRNATQWLSVSVDPLADTPAALAAFARRMDAERPGWRFATGAPRQIETLTERMAAMDPARRPARPEDHRTSIWLFDARGELVQRFAGVPVDRTRLAREITQLAAPGAAAQTLASKNTR